jgi:competence protein ComEC
LHPPAQGPDGNENARSLVLLLRPDNLSILLTGDLEGPGLERVLVMPKFPIDVLMAPHHGSKTSNKADLANWAKPKIAISSQGPPRGNPQTANPYESVGSAYLTTWKQGAVTMRKEQGKWIAETHLTKKKLVIK